MVVVVEAFFVQQEATCDCGSSVMAVEKSTVEAVCDTM